MSISERWRTRRGQRIRQLLAASSLVCALGCERTAEGIKQDTRAISAAADESASEAKAKLESEVADFKSEAAAKLDRLSTDLDALRARVKDGVGDSARTAEAELQAGLDKARAQLGNLKAETREQWRDTKSSLDEQLSDLRRRLEDSAKKAGDEVEKTLD